MPEPLPTSPLKLAGTAPRAGDWIDLATAERRSGWNQKRLQRLCGGEWAAQGLAVIRPPRGGGKPCWHVHEHAHAHLAPGAFPRLEPFDESQLTPEQRRLLHRRKRILDGWLDARRFGKARGSNERAVTVAYLATLEADGDEPVTRRTLFEWQQRYQGAGGLAGLVDGRWIKQQQGAAEPSDPMLEEVKRLYLLPARFRISQCYAMAFAKAEAQGWPLRSEHQSRRAVARIPRAVVLWNREGKKAFTDAAEPYIERDYTTLSSNETWCADHHPMDVLVLLQDGRHVRPILTAWTDMRSRKVLSWKVYAHAPNQDTVLETFAAAVAEHGVPGTVYIDNGADFTSKALTGETKRQRRSRRADAAGEIDVEQLGGVFGTLGVAQTRCQPYHGQSKPIERWFRTVEDEFGRCWPTYCGSSPADKPEVLASRVKGGQAPTLEELRAEFVRHVPTFNATPHRGQGMGGKSPDRVYAECLRVRSTVDPLALAIATMKRVGPVKVGQNGVTHEGTQYGQYEHELNRRLGERVYLRVDINNLGRLVVTSVPEDKLVCVAACNRRLPANATAQELREALSQKRRASRAAREYLEKRPRLAEDHVDLMHRARVAGNRRAAANAAPPPPPAAEQRVATPFDDQLPALRRALSADAPRKAAGGESIDLLKVIGSLDDKPLGRFIYHPPEEPLPDTFASLTAYFRDRPQDQQEEEA